MRRMFPVRRRNNETDVASHGGSFSAGQHCWLRLLSLVSAAGAGALSAALPATGSCM